jgi:hypothetical protein
VRIEIEPHPDLRAYPEVFIGESAGSKSSNLMDQWYRAGYRYVKVRGQDRTICILRFDEIGDRWELIMFLSARALGLTTRAA